MTITKAAGTAAVAGSRRVRLQSDPTYQEFWLLRIGFAVAPILVGAALTLARLATAFPGEDLIGSHERGSLR
jgi:hypothetical protein